MYHDYVFAVFAAEKPALHWQNSLEREFPFNICIFTLKPTESRQSGNKLQIFSLLSSYQEP